MTESKDTDSKFLLEAARYFESRPTNGEDKAHWSNVYNAENCRRIAASLTHPEAQGNKDLGEPDLRSLVVTDVMAAAAHTYHYRPTSHLETPMDHWKGVVRAALLQASAKHEAAPTLLIKGESELESASNGMGLR